MAELLYYTQGNVKELSTKETCTHRTRKAPNETKHSPDNAIGTFTNDIENLVLFTGVETTGARVGGCSHFGDGIAQPLCDLRENDGRSK